MRHRTKSALLLLSALIMLLYLNKKDLSLHSEQKMSVSTSNFDKAVNLISQIRSKHPSVNGLRYRSVICTIVRNDPHIVEFLLRNLIIGFSHIVVYDNNRIKAGYDMNITDVLAPFIKAGVVTHMPWNQESLGLLPTKIKNGNSKECVRKYGMQAD